MEDRLCEHGTCDRKALDGATRCIQHAHWAAKRVKSESAALRRRRQTECPACGASMRGECVFCGYPNDSAHDGVADIVDLMGGA